MNKIPKVAYFYWGNDTLSWLRYMTLYTFRKYNPSWKMCVYVPDSQSGEKTWTSNDQSVKITSRNYWNKVCDLNVAITRLDPSLISSIADGSVPDVIKSDIIRMVLLYDFGGLWSDMDIIYFRPVEAAFKPTDATAYFCKHKLERSDGLPDMRSANYHRIGLLLGAPGNPHFGNLLQKAKGAWNPSVYQSLGTMLYKHNVDMSSPDLINIPMACVYPYNNVGKMFNDTEPSLLRKIQPKTIGWHWYGGNPVAGRYQNVLTESSLRKLPNSPVVVLLKRVLGE